MDYHSLKRRELQALCKEHNIPANSPNSVLADKLSALLNEKQKPKTQRTCMKSSGEMADGGEPAASKRQAKKVRFNPNDDLREFELRSAEKQEDVVTQRKTRRQSMVPKVDKPVVDNKTTAELVEDTAQNAVRVSRTRVQSLEKDVVPDNEKKQSNAQKKGRKEAKDVEKAIDVDKETESNVGKATRSKVQTLQKGGGVQPENKRQSKRLVKEVEEATEPVEETVVGRVRATRSKAQTSKEGGTGLDVKPNVMKKTGKQVKTDGRSVESSKEITDIPVRATRSTRQTLKEDTGNTVANPQDDKKRTRREMKATDLKSNSIHVAPVVKQESPKRKSSRIRGVDEDEGVKMEVVDNSKVTRSKAPLATKSSARSSKNKANKAKVEELDEPIKHEDEKNVSRRNSVLPNEKTEVDPQTEEAVNQPARKNTRRKSVMPKVTKPVKSPTAGKRQSKAGNTEDKKNVTRSGKNVSENDIEEVTTRTPKSRKRSGTPIIEDQITESTHGSPVDKAPEGSSRAAIKSEAKAVAKKQVDSGLKKPMSVEIASLDETSSAIRSGATIKESRSKKRAKMSATKQGDSEDHAVDSSKEGTPVAKMRNLKLDEVSEPEATPAVVKSERRATRSNIKSEKKEISQLAIKEQPIAEVDLFSPEVGNFRPDSAAYTAPGRITRGGIKHGGYSSGSFSEKVGKKKQTRQSAHKKPIDDSQMASPKDVEVGPDPDVGSVEVGSEVKQPLDEVQMSSPVDAEVESNPGVDTIGVQSEIKQLYDNVQMGSPEIMKEVQPNPDNDTAGVGSEISKEVTGQLLGDLSASESARLPTKAVDEDKVFESETAINLESARLAPGEDVSAEVMEEVHLNPDSDTVGVGSTGGDVINMESTSLALGENVSVEVMEEVMPNPDRDIVGVGCDISKVATDQILGDLPASESALLPTKAVEESKVSASETAINMESASLTMEESVSVEVMEEVQPNPDSDTEEVGFEASEEVTGQLLGDLSASESARLPTEAVEENKVSESGTAINMESASVALVESVSVEVMEDAGACIAKTTYEANVTECLTEDLLSGEQQNPLELQSFEAGTPLGKDLSHIKLTPATITDVADTVPVAVSDASHVQNLNEEVYGEPGISGEAVNLETSVLDSGRSPVSIGVDVQENLLSGNDVRDDGIDIETKLVVEDNSDVQKGESEDDQLTGNANHVTDEEDAEDDDDSEPAQNEATPVAAEVFVTSQEPQESLTVAVDDVPCGTVGRSDAVTSKDARKTLATGGVDDVVVRVNALQESVVDINKDVVSSILGDTYDTDVEGDSENEQKLTEGDEDFQPNDSGFISSDMINESTKEQAETSGGYGHTLDDQEHAAATDDDLDSGNFIDGGSPIGVNEMDSELFGNLKAHEDPAREEASPIPNTEGEPTVDGIVSSQAMGDIGAHESLITKASSPITYKNEELSVDDIDSDLPTIKEDDRKKQEEPRNASTSVDWGDYDFDLDQFEKPKSANGSADEEDDQGSDFQTSVRTSYYTEESSGLAAGLANSARKLEVDSRNAADENSNQEVDTLKERANAADMTEEVFNYSGTHSSLKSLFATPAATRISHVRDNQEDAAKLSNQDAFADSSLKSFFATPAATQAASQISHIRDNREDAAKSANQDAYSSLKSMFATPTTRFSNVNTSQEEAVDLANQEHYSSLKHVFKTPGVTQFSHVKDGRDVKTGQEEAVSFANQDHYSSLKSLFKTPAVTQSSHGKDAQEDAVDFANQTHYSSHKPSFKTPTVTQTSQVKGGQEYTVHYADQDPYSSLKPFFATPDTAQISHLTDTQAEATNLADKSHYSSSLKTLFTTPATSRSQVPESKADAVNFTFPGGRHNDVIGSSRTAAHEFNRQWGKDQSQDFDGETQGKVERGPGNEIHGVSSFEDYSYKLFEDEVDVSVDRSGNNRHFEFKQVEFLNEAAGPSHHDPSGLNDNSTSSHEFKKQEDTLMKDSDVDDDLAFSAGTHDYRGNNQY